LGGRVKKSKGNLRQKGLRRPPKSGKPARVPKAVKPPKPAAPVPEVETPAPPVAAATPPPLRLVFPPSESGGVHTPDGEDVPDVIFSTQREAAGLMGLHYNTVGNWYEAGNGPPGEPPWSLKQWCVVLRAAGKLPRCKPTRQDAHAVWHWAFMGDLGPSVNPDDPVHPPPVGWQAEQQRQMALAAMTNRLRAQVELETTQGERIPIEEYRRRRARDRDAVITLLDSVHGAVKDIPGLTLDQRSALNHRLADWVRASRTKLAATAPVAQGIVVDPDPSTDP
jgi:hypothetical protein